MAGDKARLASIGLGRWGAMLVDAVNRSGAAEVVTCFARSEEGRKAFADKFDCRRSASYDEVLNDPEVEGVIIATPHLTHADMICEAASAGKHVFVEKPLTLTVAEGKRSYEATQKAGVALQVGHHRRRQGANRRIREMLDNGELGMLHQLEANLSLPMGQNPSPGWREDTNESPAGGLTGLGVHMIDNLQYLAGPIKRVSAFSKQILGAGNLDDATCVALEFESGPLGYMSFSLVLPKICVTHAFGTEAAVWSEEEGAKLFFQKKDQQAREQVDVDAGDALADQMVEFARCIREGGEPEAGGPSSIEVVAVQEAVIESVASGKTVDVANYR
ncbi:MAG: Gfo/Idh/MocA family oxidoreductase [Nitrospinaceae bacterium]|jgi:predicted dehydrogenase|nr:Gfo/Idh/MocA family oxidoreductase [Nitrospinaceae bacterium]MBT4429341.1 Gfo/Idh/MocA family oxidoreductase [Nitrospinaceae bacterium]MBT5367708.1 Gfo/Idh/MocA family oxidoreductase [Nitrospinaceae bacterium]MBT5947576.1 Gfo/Idh/MocA family oxidoreductase [Nitrospinaceae bacterium]MBT6394037.1 Gfo/Idh/MocA family oxidoreductase [Nitrospinaceae bacterium]